MNTYTMTFVSGDVLGLPADTEPRDRIISGIVTEKLSKHELELADFNWSGNYSFDNSLSYLSEPYKCNVVVEVRINLDLNTILSRKAIYDRCLDALMLHEVFLTGVKCLDNNQSDLKCVLCFDMKSAA
ncbi:hypothetical protein [Flavobacterium cerinum]|uniref:Uncharacterized protein n=1 Tax=Flavobacterium cerinum TaxID=2502784 RepID=A0A3S4ST41_9FLAO|nr:hypothetical protein [Flavobacterium cerinum]RWW91807.1 hypothetical protein EPI11_18165 [Flavobacterium cerinum]